MALIAVDFDHTLVEGDQPREGAREAVNILREMGHKIIIHSCNNTEWIEKVLNNHDIRFDDIWTGKGKPVCRCYIDDLAVRFYTWGQTLPEVLAILKDV